MAERHWGLRLTVGGAPETPHMIPGIPGFYAPDRPTPLSAWGIAHRTAKGWDQDPNIPLALIEIPAARLKEVEALAQADADMAAKGLGEAARHPPVEIDRFTDERAAMAAAMAEDPAGKE